MYLLNKRILNPQQDDPEYCERCGAPIRHVYEIEDREGEMHQFGSECIRIILPKSERWFELYLEALALGIVDYFGREVVTAMFTTRNLKEFVDFADQMRAVMTGACNDH